MRAATRKSTEQHKDEMAIRTMKRDLRRRRRIGLLITQAKARALSAELRQRLEDAGEKVCESVDCD